MPTTAEKDAIRKARQQAALEREELAHSREAAAIRVQSVARRYVARSRVKQRREHLLASGEMARVILSQVRLLLATSTLFRLRRPCPPHACTQSRFAHAKTRCRALFVTHAHVHHVHVSMSCTCACCNTYILCLCVCTHAAPHSLARGPTRSAGCRLPGFVPASSRSRARAPEVEQVEESIPAERAADQRADLPRPLPLFLSRAPCRCRLSR